MNFLLRWERIIYDFLSWKFRPKFHLNKMKSRILKCSVYLVRSFLFLYACELRSCYIPWEMFTWSTSSVATTKSISFLLEKDCAHGLVNKDSRKEEINSISTIYQRYLSILRIFFKEKR